MLPTRIYIEPDYFYSQDRVWSERSAPADVEYIRADVVDAIKLGLRHLEEALRWTEDQYPQGLGNTAIV